MTAFAPHTTGVPFYAEKSGDEQLQQVAKQLFDVGVLFDAATDCAGGPNALARARSNPDGV